MEPNGKDYGPLAGWVIALAGGKYILGRPSSKQGRSGACAMVLQPAFEIELMLVPTPQGPVHARNINWILNSQLIRQLDLPLMVPTIPIEDFPMQERQQMAEVIEGMEKQASATRAGIVLAPAGAIPKQPQRG